jgi:phosphatidyl-myo-inositol dimannoside synthase
MNPNRILIISSEFLPNVGGIGNHAYNLSLYLQNNGFTVTALVDIIGIAVNDFQLFSKQQPFNIVPIFRQKNVLATYWQRIIAAKKLAQQNDIIITSGKFSVWLNTIIKGKKLAIVHGSELDLPQAWAKKLMNKALLQCQHIVAVSHFTASKINEQVKAKIQITVIHNGIQINEFKAITSAKKIIGTPALVTLGSVTERKGQENVIRALPVIVKQFPQVHYHIIGKPVIKTKLQNLAIELGIEKHITFYNQLNRKELLHLLAAADIKMMLSNYTNEGDFEGFGIGIIEANALGKPAIGSNNAGIVDAIENYKTGILVQNNHYEQVVNSISEIINNYSSYSTDATIWAAQHDWQIIIQQYIAVINKL